MSDYYGYEDQNQYQGQDDLSFLMELFGSPQYGDQSMGMPGSTFANRLSNLKGIEGLLGIPLTQLMGGGSVGGVGAPAPMQNESYTKQVYGSNPQFADGFTAIDSGVDPQSVYQEMVNKRKEYGISFEPGTPEFEDWSQRTFKVLNDYAFEQAENTGKYNQDMAEWEQSGANAGNMFSIAGKKYQGSPDINGFASQADLMGNPDIESLMMETAMKRRRDNTPTGRGFDGQAVPGVNRDDVMAEPFHNGVHKDNREDYERKQAAYFSPGGGAGRSNSKLDKYQAQYDKVHLTKGLNKAQGTMVRSDANAEAMRKVLAMRALLGA